MTLLPVRNPIYMVPNYSVTGDILSFSRCGLQYRYLNGSSLPPSRPVQMWFGEFIHGVLELATRYFQEGHFGSLPWDSAQIDSQICAPVVARLATEGKTPRSRAAEENARNRALVAINQLGPDLFPLVEAAEVSVSGTRRMPPNTQYRASYFEITGRIDLVTSFRLDDFKPEENPIVDAIRAMVPEESANDPFEVLVDYKGTRRPSTSSDEWQLYERQLQTYAWLRQRQPNSLPVVAGLVIFVNELLPTTSDMTKLGVDINKGETDVIPEPNSLDQQIVLGTRHGDSPFGLSWGYRLARALRVVPVDDANQKDALDRFDGIVEQIESSVDQELSSGSIQQSWTPRPVDETCVACDFQTVCPMSPYLGPALAPLGRRSPDDF